VGQRVKGTTALRDALLHPVRLEILRCFELHGERTINDIVKALPSVPIASVYRHVSALVKAGALSERGTRQGERGAPERLYALIDEKQLRFAPKGKQRTPELLRRLYASMVAAQTAEFERGLLDGAFPAKYFHVRHSLIFVNDEELAEVRAILERLAEFTRKPPKGRVALDLGVALFPVKRRRR
jgi:DNA-binding transcriptional ArsR family regulator